MNKKLYICIYILFFLTMMMLGSVYTYTVYRPFIENKFQVTISISGLPYMFSLGFFSISMIVTGKLMRKVALKILIIIGSMLLMTSWIGAALSNSILMFTLFYGVFMGISVGIFYGAALQFVQRYATHHSGFFVGVMLLAFGLSSVILAPTSRYVLDVYSLQTLFLYYALFSGIVTIPLVVIYPYDHQNLDQKAYQSIPYLRLLIIFTLSSMIGLMMIGLTYTIGTDYYKFDAVDVALVVSGLALLNALSRPFFGYLIDQLGFEKTAMISIGSIVIASIINSLNLGSSLFLFGLGYSIYWFNLGAWLSIMPNYIKKKHGKDLYAALYGKVFLGYGISALLGTLFSSVILDFFGNTLYLYIFILLLAFILFLFVRKESI